VEPGKQLTLDYIKPSEEELPSHLLPQWSPLIQTLEWTH